jgi:DNA mismatch repair ATPase MutS
MGCPVPAQKATIGLVDNIFTRIGADDNLLENSSTFMMEMKDMAHMINHSTEKSFLVIDELGRGTSVEDGKALAYSIMDYFLKNHCRCLFSTHFHDCHEFFKNRTQYYYCDYKFNPLLTFTYKIVEGITQESFGLHSATLAGIPKNIIDQAQWILDNYQKKS